MRKAGNRRYGEPPRHAHGVGPSTDMVAGVDVNAPQTASTLHPARYFDCYSERVFKIRRGSRGDPYWWYTLQFSQYF